MRPLAALLVAALLAGCLSLAEPDARVDGEPFSLPPGDTLELRLPLAPQARHRVEHGVTSGGGEPWACVHRGPPFAPIDWSQPVFLEIRGCQRVPPGTTARGSYDVGLGDSGQTHALLVHCPEDGPRCEGTATVRVRSVSDTATAAWTVAGILAMGLAGRLVADRWDRQRIREFVEARGGRVEEVSWQPFGRGWFGERGERVYRVRFVDGSGHPREATFKTSLWSGVWTDALPGRSF